MNNDNCIVHFLSRRKTDMVGFKILECILYVFYKNWRNKDKQKFDSLGQIVDNLCILSSENEPLT